MNYYTYNESKEYLKTFNIKSSFQFYTMVREGSFNGLLNKRPYEYFRVKKEMIGYPGRIFYHSL